ncbi:MAG: diguanylate cyclase, partial [Gammaproteobacteria bacterium]|nr:diguanylate cyclase [Gammaproteobacteria bacterium]
MIHKRALYLMALFAPLACLIAGLQLGRSDPGGILPVTLFLLALLVANVTNKPGFTLLTAALATMCLVAPEHPQLGMAVNTSISPVLALSITGIWLATALLLWNPNRGQVTIDQLVAAFAHVSAGLLILDLEGRVVVANTAAASIMGDRLSGRYFKDLVGSEVWATIRSHRAVLFKGESLTLKSSLTRPDGSTSLVSGSARLVMCDTGKPRYICVQIFDESETRDTERALADADSALKRSEEKFARVFSESPDGIVILSQEDGTIVDINKIYVEASGYLREDLIGQTVYELDIFADKNAFNEAAITLANEGHVSNQEMTLKTKTGEQVPVLVSATLIDFDTQPCILCITKDIRELRNAEEQLLESEERFRGTFENAPIGIILVNLDGQIFRANHFAAELFGYENNSMHELHISQLVPPDERSNLKEALASLISGNETISRVERRMLRHDGLEIWANFHIVVQRSADGEAMYCIIQIADITEMKTSQRRMEHMAFFDTLTNLANRRLFNDRLSQAIDHSTRTNQDAALLYLDLDQFKRVNDTLGHEVGDTLLEKVADRLTKCVRSEDTVGRPGGDEFTILLYNVNSPTDANIVAENILDELRRPITISGHQLVVTTSIGIVTIPDDGTDPNLLMRNADLAMYKAKECGRNTYQFYNEEMNTNAANRLRTEYELPDAIDHQQFELYFQPKVRLNDQKVVGVEAMIRWQHPQRGLLAPEEFVEVAEEMGAMVEIGNWMIHESCKAGCELAEASGSPITIGINISPRQFVDPDLVETIRHCLRETKLPADSVELEINESALMHDLEAASETIKQLSELGVRIAIDDFGTGYS